MERSADNTRQIVVMGGSAGGVEALTRVVAGLPADLPAAVFVTLHMPAAADSHLPELLARAGPLPARHPTDGQAIEPGCIYVAPPDHHLLIDRGRVRVARGPRENGHRPALDPMFRTAAHAYRHQVIGVVVSGTLDDGTAGLAAVKRHHGLAIVQDPNTALFGGMPATALDHVDVDHCVPVEDIGPLLARLTTESMEVTDAMTDHNVIPPTPVEVDWIGLHDDVPVGPSSGFSCPDCNGVLWEVKDDRVLRFRCRIGHAYTVNSLLAAQSDRVEVSMASTLRGLEESAGLSRSLARRARDRGQDLVAKRFEEREADAKRSATAIRAQLVSGGMTDATASATEPGS